MGYQEKIISGKSGQALKQSAQVGGRIAVPWGVQEKYGHSTLGCGLMTIVALRSMIGLSDLRDLSYDSMI